MQSGIPMSSTERELHTVVLAVEWLQREEPELLTKQPAHGRPLGGAQPMGACKATHCPRRSWQRLPRLTALVTMSMTPDLAPAHCIPSGSGQPRAADTLMRSAQRRPATAAHGTHAAGRPQSWPGCAIGSRCAAALQNTLRAWQVAWGCTRGRDGQGVCNLGSLLKLARLYWTSVRTGYMRLLATGRVLTMCAAHLGWVLGTGRRTRGWQPLALCDGCHAARDCLTTNVRCGRW